MAGYPFGSYEIKRELGRGAMGVVYEAHDPARGLDVALKVLAIRKGLSPDVRARQIQRFRREARALSALSHPNIVRVYDQGELGGRPYFTMQLVRGTTLRDRIKFQGPLSLPELVRLSLEMCDALSYVHCRDVIHRDIKPENIMLLPQGGSVLMDFGVACLLYDDAGSGGFHGSPAYMSPEQVAGRSVDGRSDVYSLAVTLYEAASGRRAASGSSLPEILHKVANEYPAPPSGLPFHFQAILLRAMAKDPALRYVHAGEMASDIRGSRIPATFPSTPNLPPPVRPQAVYVGCTAPPELPSQLGAGAVPTPTTRQPGMPEVTLMPGVGAPSLFPPVPPSVVIAEFDFDLPSTSVVPSASPLSVEPDVGATTAELEPLRPLCTRHLQATGIGVCVACRRTVCHGCCVEVVGRGIVCRDCLFGKR